MCLIKHQAIKAYGAVEDSSIYTHHRAPDNSREFHAWPLYPLYKRLGGTQKQSEHSAENPLSHVRDLTPIRRSLALSLVSTPTELYPYSTPSLSDRFKYIVCM
jgi:hypothetical protein